MKIQTIIFNSFDIKNSGTSSSQNKIDSTSDLGGIDSVSISGILPDYVFTKIRDGEFPPRLEIVKAVSAKVQNNSYQNSEVMSSIAEKLLDSPIVTDVVEETKVNKSIEPSSNSENIKDVESKAGEGFYNNPEIMNSIAENLVDALGLTSFIK